MALDGNLSNQLKEQISRENETLQAATSEQLGAMQSGLKDIYSNALTTIETDMHDQSKALAKRFRALVFLPSLVLVTISLVICGGATVLTLYQAQKIQEQRETMRGFESLGVEPVKEDSNQGFLVLPKGATLSEPRHTEDGKPFVKLKK